MKTYAQSDDAKKARSSSVKQLASQFQVSNATSKQTTPSVRSTQRSESNSSRQTKVVSESSNQPSAATTQYSTGRSSQSKGSTVDTTETRTGSMIYTRLTRFCYEDSMIDSVIEKGEQMYQIAPSLNFQEVREFVKPSATEYPHVVSLLGCTNAGKSTILKYMMEYFGNSDNSPNPNIGKGEGATTSDTNLYTSTVSLNDTKSRLFLVDYEGSNAIVNPTDYTGKEEVDLLARERAASEHLPRLALLSSDIVIAVTTEAFAHKQSLDLVNQVLIKQSLSGVESANRPILILVSNKQNMETTSSIAESTSLMKTSHGKIKSTKNIPNSLEVLETHYSKVLGVRLPLVNTELFKEQIAMLCEELKCLLAERFEEKKQNGSLISEKAWFIFYKMILENSNKNQALNFSFLLADVLKLETTGLLAAAMNFFQIYWSALLVPSKFEIVMDFSIYFLAAATIDSHTANIAVGEATIFSNKWLSDVRNNFKDMVQQLYLYMTKFEACSSTLTDKNGMTIRCKHTRCVHGNHHFVKESAGNFVKEAISRGIVRAFQAVKNLFKVGSVETWSGKFVPTVTLTQTQFMKKAEQYLDELLRDIQFGVYKDNKQSMFSIVIYKKLKEWSSEFDLGDAINEASHKCLLCIMRESIPYTMCRHLFCCSECKEHLDTLLISQHGCLVSDNN